MADAFASGHLQPINPLAAQVPWPDAPKTFTPGGFLPSPTRAAGSSPICAPGFSLMLAPAMAIGGRDALFLMTPLAGVLLVWAAFAAARQLAGPLAGAMAAVLIAVSPPVLFQIVQPMNDIATTALWMATYAALLSRRWALAGALCGWRCCASNPLPLGVAPTVRADRQPYVASAARALRPCGAPVRRSSCG
jgi:hypothetical protein